MKKVGLYWEPLEVLNKIKQKGFTGMSDLELAFLCGMLGEFKPKKIVEVGVAAGGTTTVILNCLNLLECRCEMFSVDICTQCYLDTSRITGFTATQFLEETSQNTVAHRFILGKTVAAALDEIGGEIDFVILDTMHSLPGELLDFISLYPFLDSKAVVIFHDIGQAQLGIGNIHGASYEYASLVTMTALAGERYMISDECRIARLGNIGGIRLNENTPTNVESLFLALFINWNYIPDRQSLCEYRGRISKQYDKKYKRMFEQALECNVFSLYRRGGLSISLGEIKRDLETTLQKAEEIYIYGAGEISKKVRRFVENTIEGYHIEGYIVTDKKNMASEKCVYELQEIAKREQTLILLGLDEKYHLDVLDNLYQKGFSKNVFPYNGVGFREMMKVIEYENILRKSSNERYKNTYGYDQWIRKAVKSRNEG